MIHLLCRGSVSSDYDSLEQVLLRDPFDDNVIPVVEELRRRLHPVTSQMQGDEKENLSGLHDLEVPDEDGEIKIKSRISETNWFGHGRFMSSTESRLSNELGKCKHEPNYLKGHGLKRASLNGLSFLDARATELETAAYPALDELTSKVRENISVNGIIFFLIFVFFKP
ncbi:Magnesium transporter MRS2-2 [Platanthera guangdongensis]|uniref:Magnesium transporter MRS2-2 n=1 Tax=Platanthera guangdongensis TaxID=2320717 RepID=A0ABR2MGJ4_9ASPA